MNGTEVSSSRAGSDWIIAALNHFAFPLVRPINIVSFCYSVGHMPLWQLSCLCLCDTNASMKRHLLSLFSLLVLLALTTSAASIAQKPIDAGSYFYYVFNSLTNAARPTAESSYFQKMYAIRHRMTDADISLLRSAAGDFLATAAATDIEDGGADAINQTFLSQVAAIGNQLITGLSPEAAQQIQIDMIGTDTQSALARQQSQIEHSLVATQELLPHTLLTNLSDFRDCVGPNTHHYADTVCFLVTGSYNVTSPIVVSRSGITIEGNIVPGHPTTLVRSSPYPTSIIQLATYTTNDTITGFTFDGSSTSLPGAYELNYYDIDLQQTGVAWNYVQNSIFTDTPTWGIWANYHTYISGNEFLFNTNYAYAGASAIVTYNQAGTVQSTDIQFTNNTVYDAGVGGVSIFGSLNVLIASNIFAGNQQNCTYFGSGGQIGVVDNWGTTNGHTPPGTGYFADTISVSYNTVDGPSPAGVAVSCSSGMELYGTNYTIEGNVVVNHQQHGIVTDGIGSALYTSGGATISGNYIGVCPSGNSYCSSGAAGNTADGILLIDFPLTYEIRCPTPVSPLFIISNNVIENNGSYALEGMKNSCTSNMYEYPNATSVTLSGNTISLNGYNTPYWH